MLERAIETLPIGQNFIEDESERRSRLASLRDHILQLERIEEGLCERTGEARRMDARPEAVLGLVLKPAEVKKAA